MAQRKSFLLRVPPELYGALEKWAADELRSVNGQIEYLLAQSVKQAGRTKKPRPAPPAPDDDAGGDAGDAREESAS